MHTDSHFLISTTWRWVVSFTPRPLYPRGNSPPFPLDRRLGETQSRSEWRGQEEILDPTGTRTPTDPLVFQSPCRLCYPGFYVWYERKQKPPNALSCLTSIVNLKPSYRPECSRTYCRKHISVNWCHDMRTTVLNLNYSEKGLCVLLNFVW
jgi:hypothetical protein